MGAFTDRGEEIALDAASRARLEEHIGQAIRRARSGDGGVLAAVTVPLPSDVDPVGVIAASRRPGEPWFAFEQPDADRSALAALGAVVAIEAGGRDRFAVVGSRWRRLAADAVTDSSEGVRGAGLVAVGGFAFADEGAAAAHWQGFAPASLVVPEVAIARVGDRARLTVAVLAHPDDTVEDLGARVATRLAELRFASLPLLDPSPVVAARVESAMPPEHYVGAVERAIERIRGGELEKVVLAREVLVHASSTQDPGAIHGALRERFGSCYAFCVGRGERTFVGATPELLVRRRGMRATTLALAGTARRSADPAVDDHLAEQLLRSAKNRGEQAIVTRRIERALRRHAVWVTAADEPVVVRMANVQHLATPIRAQLRESVDVLELVATLHPTPAVGGEPAQQASELIPALEGFDRGWYAGPVGWIDIDGDGEFCVALRCALLDGPEARCYAGVGVVAESDAASELAETDAKLEALLPVLA